MEGEWDEPLLRQELHELQFGVACCKQAATQRKLPLQSWMVFVLAQAFAVFPEFPQRCFIAVARHGHRKLQGNAGKQILKQLFSYARGLSRPSVSESMQDLVR